MAERASGPARLGGIGVWLRPPPAGADTSDLLDRAAAVAAAAGRDGLRSLWVSESTGSSGERAPYEAYSLLGALAVRTGRGHLGVVADGGERRAPSILAKIVTGVDVISHGRAVLSLDGDCASGPDPERLSEALTVTRLVLEDDLPTYAGRIYSIDAAVNRPAPVQAGGIPIVVFLHGSGPARAPLLETAVRLADAVVVDGGADGVREASREVESQAAVATSPGRTVEVLGRIDGSVNGRSVGGASTAHQVARLRSAGATGCLVGIPYPWQSESLADLSTAW
jgi:alkanesulfonate monooxygenase SsuD/methylene tetrahydromethanopterin reductase-like flavin-dependent oxidoreductase (luciferase family)